jgi:hypothetical protein
VNFRGLPQTPIWARARFRRKSKTLAGRLSLFLFSKLFGDQRFERRDRILGIFPFGAYLQDGAFGSRQGQQTHQAFAVGVLDALVHSDVAFELVGHLHQFRRGPQVQAQFVLKFHFLNDFHEMLLKNQGSDMNGKKPLTIPGAEDNLGQ